MRLRSISPGLPRILLAVACAASVGADCSGGYLPGALGQVEFLTNFEDGVLPSGGAQVLVAIRAAGGNACGGTPPATWTAVRSTNPDVATFILRTGGVDVTTVKAGTADLELTDATGAVVDRIPVTVDDVGSIGWNGAWLAAPPLVLDGVAIQSVPYKLVGKNTGKRVLEPAGWPVTIESGGTIARADETGPWIGVPGAAWFTVTAGGVSAKLDVTVVPIAAVAAVRVTFQGVAAENCDAQNRCAYYGTVRTVASSAMGNVYGHRCNWSSSQPNTIEVVSQTGVAPFAAEPAEVTRFLMRTSGPIDVTCSFGNVQASTVLKLAQ